MTTEQAIQEIKAIADPRAIKIWERGGMDTSKYLGANLTGLKKIAKKIGRDNDLAMDIWRTGFHDAKLLATYICEPKKVTEEQIDEWIEGVGFWDLADKFVSNTVAKTPFAQKKLGEWTKSEKEFVRRSGYMILHELAKSKKDSGVDFESWLPELEEAMTHGANFVRDGANYALIAIGARSPELNARTIEIADRAGDLGIVIGGSCQAPDARNKLRDKNFK